ncbi:MAG: tetratricopeptide repeat protein [Saprospiraceae bacterium]|nr:tetratricopeptide repeat protein [Saprospiraceae bacterium]
MCFFLAQPASRFNWILLCLTGCLILSLSTSAQTPLSNPDSLKKITFDAYASDVSTADRLLALAAYYWQISPDSANDCSQKALKIGIDLKNDTLIALSRYMTANVMLVEGKNTEARQIYTAVKSVFEKYGKDKRVVQTLSNQANTYLNENKYAEARALFNEALKFAERLNDLKTRAFVLSNLGIVHDMEGDKTGAIQRYTEALKYLEQIGDTGSAARIYHNIGSLYSNLEDQQNAIQFTLKACEGYTAAGNKKSLTTAFFNLAYYYKELDSIALSEHYLNKLLKPEFPLNQAQQSTLLLLRGQVAEKRGLYDVAIPLLDSALVVAKQANSAINIHNTSATLSRIFLEKKQYATALPHARKALDLALQMGDDVSINLDQKLMAHSLAGSGQKAEAYTYLQAYEVGRDTQYTRERFQAIQNTERKYDTEKKEWLIARQQSDLREQRLWLALSLLAIMGLIAGLYWLFRSRRLKQEQLTIKSALNQLLQEQNDQLQQANINLQSKLEQTSLRPLSKEELGQITVTLSNQNKTVLALGDIFYIESKGNFVTFYTTKGVHHDWQALNHYEELLAPTTLFYRTHRSYMVNRLHVTGRRATEVLLSNGNAVAIASTPETKAAAHEWLDKWLTTGHTES